MNPKLLPLLAMLIGCTSFSASWEQKVWNKIDKEKGLPCREIMQDTTSHYGACFRDYWRDYRKCSGVVSMTASGCVIVIGREEETRIARPWCFSENCEELHRQDPVRYQLWP